MASFTVDRKKKAFILDDGTEVPIPKEHVDEALRTKYADKVYKDELETSRKMQDPGIFGDIEALSEGAQQSFLGGVPESASNYVTSAVNALRGKGGRQDLSFLEKTWDEFKAKQDATKRRVQETQEQHPMSYGAGSVIGTVGELAQFRNLPGKIAFPVMGALHSETPITEPGKMSLEALGDSAIGYIADKALGGLGKIAAARGGFRKAQEGIERVGAENLAETQRAARETQAGQNIFQAKNLSRESEMASLPVQQEQANKAFVQSSEKRVDRVAQEVGKQPITSDSLGVEDYIEHDLGRSVHAGSKESKEASNFLRAVFKPSTEGRITVDHLKNGMRSLDEAIVNNAGKTRSILEDFRLKTFDKLPERMSDSFVSQKWTPIIAAKSGSVISDFHGALQKTPNASKFIFSKMGTKFPQAISSEIEQVLNKELSSFQGSFTDGLIDPSLKKRIAQSIRESEVYKKLSTEIDQYFMKENVRSYQFRSAENKALDKFITEYPDVVANRIYKASNELYPNISFEKTRKASSIESSLSSSPKAPISLPEPSPVAPAPVVQPNLQPVPSLPQPQNMYERLGQGLEKMTTKNAMQLMSKHPRSTSGLGGAASLGILTGHLPALSTVAGPLAAFSGAKLLTSPGAIGQSIRGGMDIGSRVIYDVMQKAEKYPSYHDGIIEDPQERRSLTKEIEDDRNIPLEHKAVLQSKVNRGNVISDRLQ